MSNQNFIKNIENLQDILFYSRLSHYQTNALLNVLSLSSKYLIENENLLSPFEISQLEDNTPLKNPIENVFVKLFSAEPSFKVLFNKSIGLKPFNKFFKNIIDSKKTFDFKQELSFPKNEQDLVDLYCSLSEKDNTFDQIGILVASFVLLDKENQDYFNHLAFKSFTDIFTKNSDFELNKTWFYKTPRVSDVSISGHIDMAYHAWINNSDLVPAVIKKLHS